MGKMHQKYRFAGKSPIEFLDKTDKKHKNRMVSYVQLLKKETFYGRINPSRIVPDIIFIPANLPSGIAIGKEKVNLRKGMILL